MGSGGYFSNLAGKLATPFGPGTSWVQLAGVVVFVTVILFAWRQVVEFAMSGAKAELGG